MYTHYHPLIVPFYILNRAYPYNIETISEKLTVLNVSFSIVAMRHFEYIQRITNIIHFYNVYIFSSLFSYHLLTIRLFVFLQIILILQHRLVLYAFYDCPGPLVQRLTTTRKSFS